MEHKVDANGLNNRKAQALKADSVKRDYSWAESEVCGPRWYAVFTLPQNEKSVMKHLALRDVEAFLPTYEVVKIWKNRQRVKTVLPLFPTYLFVNIERAQRVKVLESPGVVHIVGAGHQDASISNEEIEFLRESVRNRKVEPYNELVVGKSVRIKRGSMEGVEGVLVRKGNGMRFVLNLKLINQCAAIEVGAEDLEQVPYSR